MKKKLFIKIKKKMRIKIINSFFKNSVQSFTHKF